MDTRTKIKVTGRVKFEVIGKNGKPVNTLVVNNLVVNGGLSLVTAYLTGSSPAVPVSHIAVGDGQTAPTPGDTTLESELLREAADISNPSSFSVQYQHIWAVGTATGTYYEAGLFDADTAGNMFSRVTFPELIVEDIHQLIVTWTISVTATEV